MATVEKLAENGKRAGLSIDQMIRVLDAGFTAEDLIRLIDSRLADSEPLQENTNYDSRSRAANVLLECVRDLTSQSHPDKSESAFFNSKS